MLEVVAARRDFGHAPDRVGTLDPEGNTKVTSSALIQLRDAWDIVRHVRPSRLALAGLLPARMHRPRILNDGIVGDIGDDPLRRLARLRLAMKSTAIDARGHVSYDALRDSAVYRQLVETAPALAAIDPSALVGDAERLAFWINLYNVLAIHGVLALGIRRSVMEIPGFFGLVAYRVGHQVLTLDDIENGIIRANSPHPASGRAPFGDGDPRRAWIVSRVDPRVHAALVCASESCPAVGFYDADLLDAQLDAAAANRVNGDVHVNDTRCRIELPITFRYFRADFGGESGVREFAARHADGDLQAKLARANENAWPLYFARYDWSLNRIA
ncbi:MAG: DUF547 domain-containing protein [Deltaproteobacteria bacterium]|nr:DUF547 domain-containing protein [Deltaproteobacteria bacterium]